MASSLEGGGGRHWGGGRLSRQVASVYMNRERGRIRREGEEKVCELDGGGVFHKGLTVYKEENEPTVRKRGKVLAA